MSSETLRYIYELKKETTIPRMLDISGSWASVTSSSTRIWKENLR